MATNPNSIVSVTCDRNYDPPMIVITFSNGFTDSISTQLYEQLLLLAPGILPPNPCA